MARSRSVRDGRVVRRDLALAFGDHAVLYADALAGEPVRPARDVSSGEYARCALGIGLQAIDIGAGQQGDIGDAERRIDADDLRIGLAVGQALEAVISRPGVGPSAELELLQAAGTFLMTDAAPRPGRALRSSGLPPPRPPDRGSGPQPRWPRPSRTVRSRAWGEQPAAWRCAQ